MNVLTYYRIKISKDFDSLTKELFTTINFRDHNTAVTWLKNKGYKQTDIGGYRKGILSAKITAKELAFGIEIPPTSKYTYKSK